MGSMWCSRIDHLSKSLLMYFWQAGSNSSNQTIARCTISKKNRIVILIYMLTVLVLLRAAKRLELLLADLLTDDDQLGRKCSEPVTICRREL